MQYSLLIVDDEPSIRNGLIQYQWDALGFEVVGALENGKEALDYVLENPVDVVLCDIKMPILDGLEFAKEVWERKLKVIVVFLTGFMEMEYIRKAMRYGCKDYLLKPTRFKQLEELFRHLAKELDSSRQAMGIISSDDEAIIKEAKLYILNNLESVSLETVATHLGLTGSYFSKLFKEKTSLHFSEYCQQERMQLAKRLLSDPRNNISDIASSTGYSNATNFARAFRSLYGVTPSEYREQEMN